MSTPTSPCFAIRTTARSSLWLRLKAHRSMRTQLGFAEWAFAETKLRRMNGRPARQQVPQHGVRHHIAPPVPLEDKSGCLAMFTFGQPCLHLVVRLNLQFDQPEFAVRSGLQPNRIRGKHAGALRRIEPVVGQVSRKAKVVNDEFRPHSALASTAWLRSAQGVPEPASSRLADPTNAQHSRPTPLAHGAG